MVTERNPWLRRGYWITLTLLIFAMIGQVTLINQDKDKCIERYGAVQSAYCDAWASNQHQFGLASALLVIAIVYGIASKLWRMYKTL